jgi:hypothetical protein
MAFLVVAAPKSLSDSVPIALALALAKTVAAHMATVLGAK